MIQEEFLLVQIYTSLKNLVQGEEGEHHLTLPSQIHHWFQYIFIIGTANNIQIEQKGG